MKRLLLQNFDNIVCTTYFQGLKRNANKHKLLQIMHKHYIYSFGYLVSNS